MRFNRCSQCDDTAADYNTRACPHNGGGRIGAHMYNRHVTSATFTCACGCMMGSSRSSAPHDNLTIDPFGCCPLAPRLNQNGWPWELVDDFINNEEARTNYRCSCGDRVTVAAFTDARRNTELSTWLRRHIGHVLNKLSRPAQPAPQPPQPELPMTESTASPSKIDQFFDLLREVTGRGKMMNHGQPWSLMSKFAIVGDKEGNQVADCSTSNVAELLIILNDVADEVLGLQGTVNVAKTEYRQLHALYLSVLEDRDRLARSSKEMVGRLANIQAKHSAELNSYRVTGRHSNHDKHGGAAKNDGRWCDPSCSACSYEAAGWRGALEPINEMLRDVGYTGEVTEMVRDLYARNCELSEELQTAAPVTKLEDEQAYQALTEENQALRVALKYAMEHRGNTFDFDNWQMLCDNAMTKGVVTPHVMEDEITIRQQITASHSRVRAERDELRECFKNACSQVTEVAANMARLAALANAPINPPPYLFNTERHSYGISGTLIVDDTIGKQNCSFRFKDGALEIHARTDNTPIVISRDTIEQLFAAWCRS